MTPEEINLMIAEWAGVKPQDNCQYSWCEFPGVKCDPSCKNKVFTYPDYYRSNAAMDLLGVLESQGYWWEMGNCENGDKFIKIGSWHGGLIVTAQRPAISAAICTAILELIEREAAE